MKSIGKREAETLARCTAYGAEYLTGIRQHARYERVLRRLERIPGTLYELDIEHAFKAVARQFRTPGAVRPGDAPGTAVLTERK